MMIRKQFCAISLKFINIIYSVNFFTLLHQFIYILLTLPALFSQNGIILRKVSQDTKSKESILNIKIEYMHRLIERNLGKARVIPRK